MNIFSNIDELTESQGKVALACGNFDGVHLGHQELFRQLKQFCEQNQFTPAVFCFDPHPRKVLSGDRTVRLLTSTEHKLQLFKRYGINNAVIFPFNQETAMMSPELFVKKDLINPEVTAIFTGRDWRFGRSGLGSVQTLHELSYQLDFQVCPVEEVDSGPEKVSSSNIRDHIIAGEMELAEKLLGRRFSLLGKVIDGEKIAGRKLGVSTANLESLSEIIPPSAVYAGFAKVDGQTFPGVINVGYSPTFHDEASPVKVEVHLFDFNENIYGEMIEVEFVHLIRFEEKFNNIETLKKAITADLATARSILSGCEPTIKEGK